LRVCFVSSYPPNRARLSEYAQSLVRELANRRRIDEVHILADVVGDSKNRAWESSKVEVLRVWRADHPFSILGIIPCILKLRPDVVHFNVHFQSYGRSRITNFVGLLLAPICRLLGLRVVATVHNFGDMVDLEKVHVKPSFLNRLGIFVVTKLMLSLTSKVVVTVRAYVDYLGRRYGHVGVIHIPHGTSVNNYLSIDPHERVILMFGHMGPHKGLPIVLKAFKGLLKEREDVKLVVAGSSHPNFPGYLEKYKGLANPKVDYLGYVPEEDLARIFGMADLIVLPYLTTTGTSGVFHLACGFGKPVVASDLPEIREMVAEGASAFLVPPGDIEALKGSILTALDNPSLLIGMGRRNLAYATRESWERVAEAYEAVYARLLGL